MRELIIISLLWIFSFTVYAQCTPDSFTKPNIYPDTIKNLDTAYANQYYEMKMTAVIPVDTLVMGNRLPIDSIGLISLSGLPSSINYVSNSPSGYWKGGTSGCILIYGTPINSDAGVYPLNITVRAFVAGIPADYSVKGYRLVVVGNSQINDFHSLRDISVYPNPSNENISLHFYSHCDDNITISIFNPLGEIFSKLNVKANAGNNAVVISVSDLPSGLFFVHIFVNEEKHLLPVLKL